MILWGSSFAAGLDKGTLLELLSSDDLTVFSEMQVRWCSSCHLVMITSHTQKTWALLCSAGPLCD